jgi:hypothetical protein
MEYFGDRTLRAATYYMWEPIDGTTPQNAEDLLYKGRDPV